MTDSKAGSTVSVPGVADATILYPISDEIESRDVVISKVPTSDAVVAIVERFAVPENTSEAVSPFTKPEILALNAGLANPYSRLASAALTIKVGCLT